MPKVDYKFSSPGARAVYQELPGDLPVDIIVLGELLQPPLDTTNEGWTISTRWDSARNGLLNIEGVQFEDVMSLDKAVDTFKYRLTLYWEARFQKNEKGESLARYTNDLTSEAKKVAQVVEQLRGGYDDKVVADAFAKTMEPLVLTGWQYSQSSAAELEGAALGKDPLETLREIQPSSWKTASTPTASPSGPIIGTSRIFPPPEAPTTETLGVEPLETHGTESEGGTHAEGR